MLRRSWVAGVSVLLAAALVAPASAANPSINTQLFRPSAFPDHYFQTRGADLPPHLTFSGALALHYGSEPFTFVSGDRSHAVVDHQLGLDLLASASFFERVGVGLALPLFLFQRGQDGGFVPFSSFDSFAVGDLRVSPHVVVLPHHGHGFGLAVDLTFTVPTAQDGRFAGDAGVTFAPRLVAELSLAPVRAALNLGYLVRENRTFATVTARDELLLDAAVGVTLWRGLEALGELSLATAAADPFGVDYENQMEGRLGLGYTFRSGWFVRAAAGGGLLDGWGVPAWRMVAMGGFAGTADGKVGVAPRGDSDGDGVSDADDRCPDTPEDIDGFQDTDGCPDDDNDGDGVTDAEDRCPGEAEDADGFQDEDGCPDRDNDGDGIPDTTDRCPDQAETPNGIDDEDGCPDQFPVKVEGDRILVEPAITFVAPERRRLDPSAETALESLARFLTDHPGIGRLRVEAHTDAEGDAAANRALTQFQADAVVDRLVALGIAPARLEAVGYGESRPIAPNTDEWGREENRRVEFVILEGSPL